MNFSCSCTYITGALIGYTVQKTSKAWIVLAQGSEMPPCSEMRSPHLISNRTCNVLEVLPRKEDCFAPTLQTHDLVEAFGSVSRKEEVGAEIRERSAAIEKPLRYVTYLFVKPVDSALKNHALYIELTKEDKLVVYKFRGRKLSRVCELLLDSFSASLGIMEVEAPIKAVLELNE